MKDQYVSRAQAHCTLCDLEFIQTATHENSVEAELKAINLLKERLDQHFNTLKHRRSVEAYKEYDKEIVGYING